MECQYRSPGGETERVRCGDHECVCSVPTGGDVLDAGPWYPVVPSPWEGSMWAYEPNDLKYIMKEPTLQGMLAQVFSFHQLLTPLKIRGNYLTQEKPHKGFSPSTISFL